MGKKPYLLKLQREMRKNPTRAEDVLWQALRGSSLGVRFLRQKAFERYIVDFYCASANLVVELDGSVHDSDEARAYDAIRTAFLETQGLRVIRFRNPEVLNHLDQILQKISTHLPTPNP